MSLKRRITEFIATHIMLATSLFSGLVVVAIGAALYLRARPLLATHSLQDIILGETWSPAAGHFGMKPFLVGTFWVTGLAIVLAVPLCLLTAIYLAEYAGPKVRSVIKPLIDVLAGIPSVVYGVWALLVIVPFIADHLGPYATVHWGRIPLLSTEFTTGFSLLAGGIVLAIMVCPVIIAIADEVLRAVPAEYREASLVLGATRLETIWRVVIRKALPGLIAAVVLGISRALGETMAVLMVVGNVPSSPRSVFDPAYPLPALIANNYGEMMSIPQYDAALLMAALLLLLVVLAFNVLAQVVLAHAVRRAA
ncbi:MAG: phosphate ABC transporter permease subunit PstC [Armatimonadota bacterium]